MTAQPASQPTAFDIISQSSTYGVQVRQGAAATLLAAHPDAHVIIDAALVKQVNLLPTHHRLAIEATEDNKEYGAIANYMSQLRNLRLTRKNIIIAIGGGVIQDIAGFIASIYMRGIAWHYAPTTLLGMVDSCIGGKSSINVLGTKNLVGTYFPPLSVVVDPDFIRTLQPAQIVDGLCEAVKICFAHPDPDYFEQYLQLDPTPSSAHYEQLIALTLHTKKWFIEKDEFDQNERLLLNFGHTFGHAIEAAGAYAISHGVAVGLGMGCALAFRAEAAAHPRVAQLQAQVDGLLRSLPELPASLQAVDVAKVMRAFQSDKKHGPDDYVVIVPDKNGQLIRERIARSDQSDRDLAQAIEKVVKKYGKI